MENQVRLGFDNPAHVEGAKVDVDGFVGEKLLYVGVEMLK